jgi:cell filamentation protein
VSDPYVYPGTNVLRNELAIRDGAELQRIEADLCYWRSLRLATEPIPGDYDLQHLQAFHRFLFEGMYEWAGELRTVPVANTDLFCMPEHIESYGKEVFRALAAERCLAGPDRDRFVDRLAHYLAEVNALHPFREGNGRTQRAFFAQLAADAGYRLDWQLIDPQQNVDASAAAMQGNEGPLRELLDMVTASDWPSSRR